MQRRVPFFQLLGESFSFVLCFAAMCGQLAVLDYYFVLYRKNKLWLLWFVADAAVIVCLLWLLCDVLRFHRRYRLRKPLGDSNIRYAYVAWLVYSLVLSTKVFAVFLYVKPMASEDDSKQLKLILSISALAFFLLAGSHHFKEPESCRQNYIAFLASFIALDILDGILLLQLLIDKSTNETISDNYPLQMTILFLACFNFILPTYPLYKLRCRGGACGYMPELSEKCYELFYFASVNVPYLVIRAYVYSKAQNSADAYFFIMKNVIMVLVSIRELWVTFIEHQEMQKGKSYDSRLEEYEENDQRTETDTT